MQGPIQSIKDLSLGLFHILLLLDQVVILLKPMLRYLNETLAFSTLISVLDLETLKYLI